MIPWFDIRSQEHSKEKHVLKCFLMFSYLHTLTLSFVFLLIQYCIKSPHCCPCLNRHWVGTWQYLWHLLQMEMWQTNIVILPLKQSLWWGLLRKDSSGSWKTGALGERLLTLGKTDNSCLHSWWKWLTESVHITRKGQGETAFFQKMRGESKNT